MAVEAEGAIAALDRLMVSLHEATHDGVEDGAKAVQDGARAFAPHLSGELAGSITITGPTPTGVASYAALVGPTVVYGRIRELGGPIPGRRTVMTHPYLRWYWEGRPVFKRKVHQHGTHYLLHAVEEVRPRFRDMCARRWAEAIRRA